MIRHHTHRLWLLLYAIVAALVLTGCSGGGGGGGSPAATQPDNSSTVSGTAAAGAPLVGFVGAKDSIGGASTADILPDGSFELDITDLTPPVLIYASGIAGGNAYQLLSVVFEDDVNGTVNITPITDLIIGNTVSDSPQAFFNNPNFTVLTQEAVEAEEENLKKRLKPLLDGLGVEADFDLRNSTFVANRSGFDGVLDILEVTVNGGTAIIRNRVDPTSEITNTFSAPEQEVITVSENLQSQVDTLDILDTLASNFAAALENEDGPALEGLVTNDYLNNGEDIAGLQVRLFGSPEGIEDAGELANDIRNWSLVTLDTAGGTAQLNIGAAQGPWNVVNVDGDWKIQGNQLEYFAFVEPTHLIESGAETPAVIEIGTLIYAGFQIADLGSIEDSSVTISGDLAIFNGDLPVDSQNAQRFADFQVLAPSSIASGDQVTFAWNNGVAGIIDSEVTFTLRRGAPDFTNGAPRITGQSADLDADAYSFEWTLPPGYDAISVRNNFTGQTSGGQGSGFTGNPLDNDATSFTGNLPETYLPSADDELRLIARDPFGVFVAARLKNPFADQVPPPMAEDALIGSWIVRNTERADNAPFIQLTFLESGYYMHQELDQPYRTEADDSGNTGIEFGRYEWDNQTGELTVPDIIIDDNGSWGATDTASGEVRLALKVDDDTMTAYDPTVGIADGTVFTRVPLNESGITGSWLFQNSEDPSDFVVATLLEDGFYFVGSTTPAEPEFDTAVGLEFGTYTYNRETLVLNASPIFDQNGTAGLSTPSPQNFYFSTVVDGSLIFDEGVVAQLSELAPGVAPSNGDVTVDYTAPDTGSDPAPEPDVSALVGSWIARNPDNNNAPWIQFTFLESGYYMHHELDSPFRPEPDDAGSTGLEFGQYSWDNETGEMTVTDIAIDDNGFWGLTDNFNGEERISFVVGGETMTAFNTDLGPSDGLEFTRVPLNQSGITGSWAVQDSMDPSNVSVLTILDDGYYFLGTSQPADSIGGPGLEFGTYTYDSETTILEPTVASDNNGPTDYNGEFGLSDPMQGFDYATVIDSFLIIDDGEAFQLSEIAAGATPSDGTVTIAYTPPSSEPDPDPNPGTAVSGDFHYLKNVSGVEGQRENAPPSIWLSGINQVDTRIADNGNGTGTISWSQWCFGDLIVDANTNPQAGDAVVDGGNECLPESAGSIADVAYTSAGLSAPLPEESVFFEGDEVRMEAADLDMFAVDSNRNLFIGQSVQGFRYQEPNSFTDGVELTAHVLSRKTTGRATAELEGTWGFVARSLLVNDDSPNTLAYEAGSLIVNIDSTGNVTRVNELDRRFEQGLAVGSSSVIFDKKPENMDQQPLGSITVSDDGTLDFINGELGGMVSTDANVLFLHFMNPIEPLTNLVNDSQWIPGVRISETLTRADLDGNEYALISQGYWLEPERFEVDFREPGATLTFPIGGDRPNISWQVSFVTANFVNNEALAPGGDPEENFGLDYSVDANGRITLTTDFGEPGIVDLELNGFSSPDGRLLVFENTLIDQGNAGTGPKGGLGIIYAICTNCD